MRFFTLPGYIHCGYLGGCQGGYIALDSRKIMRQQNETFMLRPLFDA